MSPRVGRVKRVVSSLCHHLRRPRTPPRSQPNTLFVFSMVPCTPSPYAERPEAGRGSGMTLTPSRLVSVLP